MSNNLKVHTGSFEHGLAVARQMCIDEAEACFNDIVDGDEEGTKILYAKAGALLTMSSDLYDLVLKSVDKK